MRRLDRPVRELRLGLVHDGVPDDAAGLQLREASERRLGPRCRARRWRRCRPSTTVNGKQTVTYTISPTAVWSDGQPITSEDFKYTWDQIAHGKNIYDPTGYDKIESVDTTNPKVAVVTFSETFGVVDALFSADYGIFPSHILEGKNRDALMKNGYSWSGGPWIFKWDKGVSVTLTPNPKWYGTEAHDQEGDLQDPDGHRGRVPGLQVGRGLRDLPAAASLRDRGDQGRPGGHQEPVHRRHRQHRGAVDEQRQVPVQLGGGAPGDRRTRSTATRSSSGCSATSASPRRCRR